MKKHVNVVLLFAFVFVLSTGHMVEAKSLTNKQSSFLEQLKTHSLKHYEVQTITVNNQSGRQREFSIHDGFQERVLRKVVHWLNTSPQSKETTLVTIKNPNDKLTIKMDSGEVITIEPAYSCELAQTNKLCTPKEGEVVLTAKGQNVRLISEPLYDWLFVGWKKEPDGETKEKMLEEALYTRYLYLLGPDYSEFFLCPKIRIEPIDGDPRRHLIFGSALNYSGHHGGDFRKLNFSVKDSDLEGLHISNIKIEKHISDDESEKQCQTFE